MIESIFCVDDDPIAIMLAKKVISKSNFSKVISTAQNGEEALSFFESLSNNDNISTPKLIFLDLNMPVMDGWEFLDHFKTEQYSLYNNTPIVVLSSTIDPKDINKAKEYPMIIEFLSKPITVEMLNYISNKLSNIL